MSDTAHSALPKPTRPVLAMALFIVMVVLGFGQTAGGQSGDTASSPEPIDWRWAVTQGGLTVVVLVLGWSYRSRLEQWAEKEVAYERKLADERASATNEKIAFQQARIDEALRYNRHLEQLMDRTNETLKATADALGAHTTALARNTDSTHRLANSVERLDQRMERVEHQK